MKSLFGDKKEKEKDKEKKGNKNNEVCVFCCTNHIPKDKDKDKEKKKDKKDKSLPPGASPRPGGGDNEPMPDEETLNAMFAALLVFFPQKYT